MANQISKGWPDSGKGSECPPPLPPPIPPWSLNVTEQTTHNSKEREVERGGATSSRRFKADFLLMSDKLCALSSMCVCERECMFMCVHLCVGVV